MYGKKILIGFEGSGFDREVLNFGLKLFRSQQHLFVGVLVNNVFPAVTENEPAFLTNGVNENIAVKNRQKAVGQFRQVLDKEELKYTIHNEQGSLVEDLIKESKFADVLVISSQLYNAQISKSGSGGFFRKELNDLHCPVIVVPNETGITRHFILVYDGNPSSLQAIRQFCYLFPDRCLNDNVVLMTVPSKGKGKRVDMFEEKLLVEYLRQHCTFLSIHKVLGDSTHAFLSAMDSSTDSMIVIGKSEEVSSQGFHEELVEKLIKSDHIPVFIGGGN